MFFNWDKMIALAAVLGVAGAQPVFAQGMENEVGKALFENSCAACHGSDAAGDGEFAQYLNVRPSDLTLLKKNNDNVFPYLKVFQTVDGRAVVRGHGSPMPVWGDSFAGQVGNSAGPYGAELMIRAQIVAIVDYVESLQKD